MAQPTTSIVFRESICWYYGLTWWGPTANLLTYRFLLSSLCSRWLRGMGMPPFLDNINVRTCFPYKILELSAPQCMLGYAFALTMPPFSLNTKKQEWMNVSAVEQEFLQRHAAVRNTQLILLCNSQSLNFRSNVTIFIFNKPRRLQSGNKNKERLHCALLYSLPVESMLAWQHSQLVFHFEVL